MLRHLLIFYSIYEFLAFILAFERRFFHKNCSEGNNEQLLLYFFLLFLLIYSTGKQVFRYTAMLAHSWSSSKNPYFMNVNIFFSIKKFIIKTKIVYQLSWVPFEDLLGCVDSIAYLSEARSIPISFP